MNINLLQISRHQSDAANYENMVFVIDTADIIDVDKASELWIVTKSLIDGGVTRLIVNMDGLDFIDSRGIGILINIAKFIREKHGDMVLLGVPENIERIFRPVNLQRFIKMYKTEAEALSYFKYM